MAATPEQHAALIHVMRWAGIPVSIEAERASAMPPPAALTPEMSGYVEQVAAGMTGPDAPSDHEVANQIAFVRQHALTPFSLVQHGRRSMAVDLAAAVVQVIEQLARAGSELAAGMLLYYADLYGEIGISAEAFDLARRRTEDA